MNDEQDPVEVFYRRVAELLECDDHYEKFPFLKRTRWNNRNAGNGRYLGHGLVRYFGPNHILVNLIEPSVNGLFTSSDAVFEAILIALTEP